MKNINEAYRIKIQNMKPGVYLFAFEVDNTYFKTLDRAIIEKGHANITAQLDYNISKINLQLAIQGTITLICDRSLREFEYPVNTTAQLIFKPGHKNEEVNPGLYEFDEKTKYLDLTNIIFETIALEIPIKKIHPDFPHDSSDESMKDTLFFTTGTDTNDEIVEDPRWEKLKKLKDTF